MSRGPGNTQGAGLGLWAACQVTGATPAFTTSTQHPGFATVARHPAAGTGDWDVTLQEALAVGSGIAVGTLITHSLAGLQIDVVQQDTLIWRVRVYVPGGALADADWFLSVFTTNPL